MSTDLVIKVIADTQKSIKELGEVQKGLTGIARQIRNLQLVSMGLGVVKSVIGTVTNTVKNQLSVIYSWIQAYEEAAVSQIKLASAIKAAGLDVADTMKKFKDLADEIKSTTSFAGSAVEASARLFVAMGKSADEVETLTRVSADLAAALGVDLPVAAELLGKSLLNPVAGLKKLVQAGAVLDKEQIALLESLAKTGDQVRYQSTLIDVLKSNYEGLSQRLALSTKMIGHSWGDLQETFGKFATVIYGALVKMIIPVIQQFSDSVGDSNDIMQGLIEVVAEVLSVVQTLAQFLIYAAQGLLTFMRNALGIWDSVRRLLGYTGPEVSIQIANLLRLDSVLDKLGTTIQNADWAESFRQSAQEIRNQFENLEDVPGNISNEFSSSFSEASQAVMEDIDSIRKELEQIGMTDIEKKLAELREKGATKEQLEEAQQLLEQIESINKAREEENEKIREAQKIREQVASEEEKITAEIESAQKLFQEGYLSLDDYLKFLEKQKQTIQPEDREETTRYASAVMRGAGSFSAIISAMEAYRKSRDSPEAQTAKNTSKLVSLIERLIQEQTNQEVIEI